MIKMRHSIFNRPGDINQRKKMKEEIEGYLAKVYQAEAADEYKDVYVTDHVAKQKKFSTINKKEDEQFF